MIEKLNHITLTTGHARWSPRTEVAADLLAQLIPMLAECERAGRVDVPGPERLLTLWRLDPPMSSSTVGCWALGYADRPSSEALVTIGVALQSGAPASALWRALCSIRQHPAPAVIERPDQPREAPWLAVIPHLPALLDRGASAWLGDAERCIAWAWIAGQES